MYGAHLLFSKRRFWLFLFGIPLVLLVTGFAALQLPPGKWIISKVLSQRLSQSGDFQVTIDGLSGWLPLKPRIKTIQINTKRGPFLTLTDTVLRFSFTQLLQGNFEIRELQIGTLDVWQRPVPRRKWHIPYIPMPPFWPKIHSLNVPNLTLHEAVVGKKMVMTVSGSVAPIPGVVYPEATLDLRGAGVSDFQANFALSCTDTIPQITLRIYDNSALPALLKATPPVEVVIDGQGNRTDWSGIVRITSSDTILVSGSAQFAEDNDTAFTSTLILNTAYLPYLSTQTNVWGDQVTLTTATVLDSNGVLHINDFSLSSETIHLSANGNVRFEEKEVDVSLDFGHSDISFIQENSVQDALPLASNLRITGPFHAATVLWESLLGDTPLALVQGQVNIAMPFEFTGAAFIQSHPFLCEKFPCSGEPLLQLETTLTYTPKTELWLVNKMVVSTSWITVEAHGDLTSDFSQVNLVATAEIEDISPLSHLLDIPLEGKGRTRLTLNTPRRHDATELVFEGQGQSLTYNNSQIETIDFGLIGSLLRDTTGMIGSAQVSGLVTAHKFRQPSLVSAEDIELKFSAELPSWHEVQLKEATLYSGQSSLTGTFSLNRERNGFKASFQANPIDLSMFDFDVPKGTFQGRITAKGTLKPLFIETRSDGTVQIESNQTDPFTVLLGNSINFIAEGFLKDSRVELSGLRINSPHIQLVGNLTYQADSGSVNGRCQVDMPDILPLAATLGQKITGNLSLSTEFIGTLQTLEAQANLTGQAVWGSYELSSLETRLLAKDLTRLRPEIQAQGTCKINKEPASLNGRLSIDAQKVNLSSFDILVGKNQISITGILKQPLIESNTQITATFNDLTSVGKILDKPIAGVAQGKFTFQNRTFQGTATTENCRYGPVGIGKSLLTIQMAGTPLPWSGTASLKINDLNSESLRLEQCEWNASGNLNTLQFITKASGKMDFLRGKTASLKLQAEGEAETKKRIVHLKTLTTTVDTLDLALTKKATFNFPANGIAIDPVTFSVGTSGLLTVSANTDKESLSASLNFRNLPISNPIFFSSNDWIRGLVNGEITLSGTFQQPELSLSAKCHATYLNTFPQAEFSPLEANVTLRMSSRRASVEARASLENALELYSELEIPLKWQLQPWNFHVESEILGNARFRVLPEPFLEAMGYFGHYFSGTIEGNFAYKGTSTAAHLEGSAWTQGSQYHYAGTGTYLDNLNVRVSANGSTLDIVEGTARMGDGGTVSISGNVLFNWEQRFPLTGELTFSNAQFFHLDYADGRMTGKVDLTGNIDTIVARGDLTLSPLHITIPEQLPQRVPAVPSFTEIKDGTVIAQPRSNTYGLGHRVALDLRCALPGKAYITAPVLDSEWTGNVTIRGVLADMRLDGRIAAMRGHLNLLGRRFMLRDSAIVYTGTQLSKPYLDLLAHAETKTMTAQLKLVGDLNEISMELNSDPPMPRDNILAQLLFGRNTSRLSAVQAIQLARVAAMFNHRLSGIPLLSGNVSLPGIDRIDIRTGERLDETVVGIGKYFTESVYVEVEQGAASESSKVSVEVEVNPKVTIKGDVDAKERSGIGIFWRKDY